MPQIVVTADGLESKRGREVMRERVAASDLESQLFIEHLVERIEWALGDADSIEAHQSRRRRIAPTGAERHHQHHLPPAA